MNPRHSVQWPYRQNDPEWADDTMWVNEKVLTVHQTFNGATPAQARALMFGDTIATEGCLLTCLAMTLRLLALDGEQWTPRTLNHAARELLYYTDAGISNVPLYADLVADVTNGQVQVCVQEQYFAGEGVQPARFASQCSLLRGYRTLPAAQREDFVVMLKMGTHDDTFASHYVLVDPDRPGPPDDDDIAILDPDQPSRPPTRRWCLSDSYAHVAEDADIAREWRDCGIRPMQLSAVWAFARWRERGSRCLAGDLFKAIADC